MRPHEKIIGNKAEGLTTKIVEDERYDEKQAAELLLVTPDWLRIGRHKGYGPEYTKLHRRCIVYTGRQLLNYIASCARTPMPKSAA